MKSIFILFDNIVSLYIWVLIINVIMSWLVAFNIVNSYRNHGMFACNGILFNHESPRRGSNFVTMKIVEAAVKIKLGKIKTLYLGNIYSKRDWGYAKEYVEAMWKMLQQKKPDDYVIATGKQYSVKQFVNLVSKKLKMKIIWKGKGINEKGYDINNNIIIECDKNYFRPLDVVNLLGDAKKSRKKLNWKPKTNLDSTIDEMIKFEYQKFNEFK